MAPFADGKSGPLWLTESFPPVEERHQKRSLVIWRRIPTPQFLSGAITQMSPCLTAYQPNLVARQFGLYQIVPKSLYPSHELLMDILDNQGWEVIKETVATL